MKALDTALKYGVGVACAYEVVAIFSGAVPTISHEVGVNWWIGPFVLVALAVHFYWTHIVQLYKKVKR